MLHRRDMKLIIEAMATSTVIKVGILKSLDVLVGCSSRKNELQKNKSGEGNYSARLVRL